LICLFLSVFYRDGEMAATSETRNKVLSTPAILTTNK
jgi:hypothetical protein